MKTILLSGHFFLLLSLQLIAQNQQKIDSLHTLLRQSTADTAKVRLLNDLFMEYLFVDIQRAKEVAEESLSLSKDTKFRKGQADALNRMGIYHYATGNYGQALTYYDSALTLFKAIDNLSGQSKTMNNIAVIYDIQGESEQAMEIYQQTTSLSKALHDQSGLATAFNNIGNIFLYRGAYDSALAYFRRGLEIRKEIQEMITLGDSYFNIGYTHHLQGNYEPAIDNYFQSLEIYEQEGLQWNIATAYQGLSTTYLDYQKYGKAREFTEKGLAIMESLADKRGIASAYENLGTLASYEGDAETALGYYQQSLALKSEMEDHRGSISVYLNVGQLYRQQAEYSKAMEQYEKGLVIARKVGDIKSEASIFLQQGNVWLDMEKYREAYSNFDLSLQLAGEIGSRIEQQQALHGLYEAAMKLGKYTEAYAFNQQYITLKDSLFNQKTLQQLNELEAKYQSEKKEKEIALLTVEKELRETELKQKSTVINIIITGFILVLALGVLAFRFYQQKARTKALIAEKDAEINRKKIEELEKNQKMLAMDAMIAGQEEERKRIAKELHDGLGGLLSTVQLHFSATQQKIGPIQEGNGLKKAAHLLDDACGEVRRIAHNMMPGALMKLGLVPALQDICNAMEQAGVQVELQVFNLEERLDEPTEISVYRIIQELMSNIRKHAHATEVIIQLSQSADTLSITVEDDGTGFHAAQARNQGGIGLKSIESRVKYLNGTLDIDARVGEGTSITIEIPIKKAVQV